MQTHQVNYDNNRLGPLSQLIGSWEGEKGHDIFSSEGPLTDTNYRESITFEPFGPIKSGHQNLYGLRYTTRAWPQGEETTPIHQELGYWLWSPEDQQVVRCFTNQNGVAIHAGGKSSRDANGFKMSAHSNSDEHGISSSPLLNNGFKTVSYSLKLDMLNDKQFEYTEEMHLKNCNSDSDDVLIHTDKNAMTKLF